MNHGSNDKLPKLEKQVNLAGHFDGIIRLDDKVNRNYFLKTGAPRYQNDSFRDLYQHRNNYPKKQVDILNIYGNLDDGTNSDGRVSNVSSRSLKYILQDRYHSYREIEIHGAMGQ
ncbi:alpha/beta hydrolase [Leuconostoc carnosum]|uniref:alpha/beta hydrolase n=1 Tax=Leuconostoc carnosum TaxID=1252 RepID=UPI0021DFC68A|nr:alpha/beta hydrolase [Leuconostoc carnosum]